MKCFVMLLKEDNEPCFHDQLVTMTESFAPKVTILINTMLSFSENLIKALSILPKIPETSVRNQMEQTILVWSDWNIWKHR